MKQNILSIGWKKNIACLVLALELCVEWLLNIFS